MAFLDDIGTGYLVTKIKKKVSAEFQKKLISGTNIKTINDESILGSGNLSIIDDIYPVGSVYWSAGGVDPNTAFGGTWTSTSVPYICSSKTDEPTTEGWFWRKWSDGTSECWGVFETSGNTTWSSWGSLYYTNSQYYDYPSNIFAEGCYSVQASVIKASQDIISIGLGTGGTRNRTPNMFALRAGSSGSTTHCVYQIHAIGKWTITPLTNIRWTRTA